MRSEVEVVLEDGFESYGEPYVYTDQNCDPSTSSSSRLANFNEDSKDNETLNQDTIPVNAKELNVSDIISSIYPNPFSDNTTIEYTLQENSPVKLNVYNVYGQLLTVLADEQHQPKGNYRINFNAAQLKAGAYYYTLITKSIFESKKILIIK